MYKRQVLANAGIDKSKLTEMPVKFDITPLLTGTVDVWPGYLINEVLAAKEKGFDVNVIYPVDYGIDLYADTLSVSYTHLRHRNRPLGQSIEAVAFKIIGRNDRLLVANDNAQAKVVSLGALRFLDGAVAHINRKRYRAHGERVGLIGAGAARGGHEAFGEIGEVGLVKKRWHVWAGLCGGRSEYKVKM